MKDKATKAIVFFGEVGGTDEYEVARLLEKAKKPKPLIVYIAGVFAEKFDQPTQFGHAKSMAQSKSETATAKKQALKASGAVVADSFEEFEKQLINLPKAKLDHSATITYQKRLDVMQFRKPSLFMDRISSDKGGQVKILGEPLLDFIEKRSLTTIALSMFLGTTSISTKLSDFFDLTVRLLVDHGPQVAGAVNTMITARASKDLPASLASGLLTIGPRFGGAINRAAHGWFEAVTHLESADSFVERHAKNNQFIAGIGHVKYRLDNPDPRVKLLLSKFDKGGQYINFAKQVAAITTRKKAQLILNVDGAVAALLLDILANEEKYSPEDIKDLINTDFCNAIFIYARTTGLIAHHLEQQRLDERLFRLPDDLIGSIGA